MRYPVILFDLFGTLALLTAVRGGRSEEGVAGRWSMEWLRHDLETSLPETSFDDFRRAVRHVTREIVDSRPPRYREIQSEERFRRVLSLLGLSPARAAPIASSLCTAHMRHLAQRTYVPDAHVALLRRLGTQRRLGLVSNFDHGPTAHEILRHAGIDVLLEVRLVSADVGIRKPHPRIFRDALRRMGATTADTLYVGDTPVDDVGGAVAAGIDAVWINRRCVPLPAGVPAPVAEIHALTELPGVL